MDVDDFTGSSVGVLVPVQGYDNFLKRAFQHFAFVPAALSHSVPLHERTYQLVSEAERAVGRLDTAADRLPNPNLLVRAALRLEAKSTSALEGTYAPLLEVLEADFVEERRRSSEVREIMNYVRAAERGLELVQVKPICVTAICELQEILVRGTRGGAASPGRLRQEQVYIGERHLGIEQSRFVPPPPGDTLRDAVHEWEAWLNTEDFIPLLAKVALTHFQFESLHPFFDGNGRLGRLIIALQLVTAGALKYPLLNLSPWLEPRKDAYKDLMLDASKTGDFNPWVQFFAQAVIAQANDGVARIERLMEIRDTMLEALRAVGAKGVVLEIPDDLIGYPVITISQAAELHGVTFPPASSAIRRLVDLGFLFEMTGRSYGRVFGCTEIMQAVEDEAA